MWDRTWRQNNNAGPILANLVLHWGLRRCAVQRPGATTVTVKSDHWRPFSCILFSVSVLHLSAVTQGRSQYSQDVELESYEGSTAETLYIQTGAKVLYQSATPDLALDTHTYSLEQVITYEIYKSATSLYCVVVSLQCFWTAGQKNFETLTLILFWKHEKNSVFT